MSAVFAAPPARRQARAEMAIVPAPAPALEPDAWRREVAILSPAPPLPPTAPDAPGVSS